MVSIPCGEKQKPPADDFVLATMKDDLNMLSVLLIIANFASCNIFVDLICLNFNAMLRFS